MQPLNSPDRISKAISELGFAIVRGAVPREIVTQLQDLCATAPLPKTMMQRRHSVFGIRNLLKSEPRIGEIVSAFPFIELARQVLGDQAHPVKATFFDKTADANWPVPWHQDVTITVKDRRNIPGFEFRPVKNGFIHALPPIEISERLLAMRIHLDPCGTDHGALRVIPGSHQYGRLNARQIEELRLRTREETLSAEAGDLVLMRPLLLHCSSTCERPDHRRVIHIEFAANDLPGGLQWTG